MSDQSISAAGGCLCGGVRYEVRGPLRPVVACHCSQCARTSGNYAAMTACATGDLHFVSDKTLAWYRSSSEAERGFCSRCGGNLFWKPDTDTHISITAGTLDPPTGVSLSEHIYVGSKSDFYDIADDLPKKEVW